MEWENNGYLFSLGVSSFLRLDSISNGLGVYIDLVFFHILVLICGFPYINVLLCFRVLSYIVSTYRFLLTIAQCQNSRPQFTTKQISLFIEKVHVKS